MYPQTSWVIGQRKADGTSASSTLIVLLLNGHKGRKYAHLYGDVPCIVYRIGGKNISTKICAACCDVGLVSSFPNYRNHATLSTSAQIGSLSYELILLFEVLEIIIMALLRVSFAPSLSLASVSVRGLHRAASVWLDWR